MNQKETRGIYFAFEFYKDAFKRGCFLEQAVKYSDYRIIDWSLPAAVHDGSWQREALKRIQKSNVVVVLLGIDTHNAPGVLDEISLAGQAKKPVIQLQPQGQHYGLISKRFPECTYRWKQINAMLSQPTKFKGD